MSIKYVVPFIALSLAACGGSSDLTALDRSCLLYTSDAADE